jgi:hypothetical protein
MATTAISADEIRRRGYDALIRELGPDGFIQFIQDLRTGQGDYTAERREQMDSSAETLTHIVNEIKREREHPSK